MSYSEKFSYQWDNLINKFKTDMDRLPLTAISRKKVTDWYETYSYVWESIVETEGIMLSDQKNKELSVNLLNAIRGFSFDSVAATKRPKIIIPMIISASVGVILGIVLKFFAFSWVWVIIEFIAFLLSGLIYYAIKLDGYEKNGKAALIEGYASYLKNYKEELIGICKKYAD